MAFSDYPSTPSAVTTIGDGIFVGPNMERGKVREAIQQLAADGRMLNDTLYANLSVVSNYFTTRAAGAAATATGEIFSSDEEGQMAVYERTATAPNYAKLYDVATQANIDELTDQFEGSSGSASVGHQQAGTSPAISNAQAELRRLIDASQFTGFDPSGVADSRTAVQNALNLVSTLGGGTVTIPNGARVLIDGANLTIPSNCHFVGPHKIVDTSQGNTETPYGTMGGVLILNSARVILVNGGGSISGLVIHRKGMTFPNYAGAGYAGDCLHLGGDGASAQNCMILGFDRAVYSRNWSRIFCANLKIDCNNGIDIRQAGDTSIIWNCKGWPFAGSRNNVDNVRSGSFIKLYGKNDWTQVVQCEEYGYLYGYELQNEADDTAVVWGPANVRIIECKSDDGFAGSAPYHTGKIAVRLGTAAATVKAFGVQIEGLQSSSAAVSAIYSNLEAGMVLHVRNCFSWNGAQFGLVYQKGGDLIVMGGENNGSGPGVSTAYGNYSTTYDVAGGSGRTVIGGGFQSKNVTTCHFRVGQPTDSFNVDWQAVVIDNLVPAFDNSSAALPGIASAADMTTLLRRPESTFYLSGNATITSLGPASPNRRIGFICSGTPTFTNNSNMRVHGNANFTVAVAGTYVEFLGVSDGTNNQWRMTGAPST